MSKDDELDSKLLHGAYNTLKEMGGFTPGDLPAYITDNLRMKLRPYQEEAINRFLHYLDVNPRKQLPVELLFNMATGSGKTLVMAALMLELFKRGRRNFVFFVNSNTIIDKTRVNFLEPSSTKYQFADKIVVGGEPVAVREVGNFNESRDDAINIVFTTIQGLHTDLNNPREGRLTYDELEDYEVVLISDEAHHLNASTKQLDKTDRDDNASWESTIDNIMRLNQQNILLEFTATVDYADANILQKYKDRVIYKYDLKAFRQDGFSKDVLIYEVDNEVMNRALQAILISQYRKKVALKHGVWCKPVVMFKSKTITESEEFFEVFKQKITELTTEDLQMQNKRPAGILAKAFQYFIDNEISMVDLAEELKTDFMEERLLLVNSKNKVEADQLKLNSLEDRNNEIRAVFSVDMLDEGWDVLNLFDIVRLYDTRDSRNNRPGKTTMREAQLIGRGARYFPFSIGDDDQKYVRKFDNNELEELRVLEQLHYHSSYVPKYIDEIKQALKMTGIMPDVTQERRLVLKDGFLKTPTYQKGVIWQNKQILRLEAQVKQEHLFQEDDYLIADEYEVKLPSGIGQEFVVFEDEETGDGVVNEKATKRFKWRDFPKGLVRFAVERKKAFQFDKLQRAFPFLASLEDFMFNKRLLGKVEVVVMGDSSSLHDVNFNQKLFIVTEVLRQVEEKISSEATYFVGSEEFEPALVKDLFRKEIVRHYAVSESEDKEEGYPQWGGGNTTTSYALNLSVRDWHVYNDNYGTSEEKSLVLLLDSMMDDLQKKWNDIYLLRNERAVRLYDFKTGRAFEPDYLLLANDKKQGDISWQIFIEPKGSQFINKDTGEFDSDSAEGWKQDFLLQLRERFEVMTLAESKDYRVVGLPFYNEQFTREKFKDELVDLTG